jgi:hypothetical protein
LLLPFDRCRGTFGPDILDDMSSSYPHAPARVWAGLALVVAVLIAAAITLPPAVAESSAAGPGDPVPFTLAAATGPEQLGTFELHFGARFTFPD